MILIGLLVWLLLRRRRRAREARGYAGGDLDGSGGGTGGMGTMDPKLEPYSSVPTSPGISPGLPCQDYTTVQHGNTVTALPSPNSPYSAYTDSVPLAWPEPAPLGAALPASMPPAQSYPSATSDTSDHLDRPNPAFTSLTHSASRESVATNPARASYFDPAPALPPKSVSPPTFTSPRTEPGPSQASSRFSTLPPGAAGTSSRTEMGNSRPMSHPHEEFEFVRHTDGGEARERVELPPDYNEVPARS